MQNLELYYMEQCPFCQKVLRFINNKGIKGVSLRPIDEPANREKLISTGGKEQIPCLFIDGEPMYESMDIIKWLDANTK